MTQEKPSSNASQDPPEEENTGPDSAMEAPSETAGESPAAPDGAAQSRIAGLQEELARMKDHLLRALAETENTRKRALREREDAGKYAIAAFARDMLAFADNFHRAMEAIPAELKDSDERVRNVIAGIESMEQDLIKSLEKHGIQKIAPLGQPFDAHFHEVIFEAPGTGKPAGTVIQVIEPGYMIKDRLLRPARVGIAKDENGGSGDKVDTTA